MKTLLESTDTSATYEFAANGARKTVTYQRPESAEENPDFAAMAEEEHEAWLAWLGDEAAAPTALDLAEAHVGRYFSTPRLLQMKVWWDALPHEDTPKLAAVYAWTNGVTVAAAGGETEYPAPPHAFEELVAEAIAAQ